MTPDEEIARSEAAKRIYEDPLFKQAMSIVRQEILDKWSATPARDTEGREWLWQLHQSMNKFELVFVNWMETGKLAQLGKEQSLLKRMRGMI